MLAVLVLPSVAEVAFTQKILGFPLGLEQGCGITTVDTDCPEEFFLFSIEEAAEHVATFFYFRKLHIEFVVAVGTLALDVLKGVFCNLPSQNN